MNLPSPRDNQELANLYSQVLSKSRELNRAEMDYVHAKAVYEEACRNYDNCQATVAKGNK